MDFKFGSGFGSAYLIAKGNRIAKGNFIQMHLYSFNEHKICMLTVDSIHD